MQWVWFVFWTIGLTCLFNATGNCYLVLWYNSCACFFVLMLLCMLQHLVIASDSAVWAKADTRKIARISRMMCGVSGRTQRKIVASQLKSQLQALKVTIDHYPGSFARKHPHWITVVSLPCHTLSMFPQNLECLSKSEIMSWSAQSPVKCLRKPDERYRCVQEHRMEAECTGCSSGGDRNGEEPLPDP